MKKLLTYPPFHFLCCVIVGILLQFYTQCWQFDLHFLVSLLCGFIVVLYFLNKLHNRKWFSITVLIFFVFIGISSAFIHNPKNYNTYYEKQLTNNSTFVLSIKKVLKPGNYYQKYIANVLQVDSNKTKGIVLLNIQKDSTQQTLTEGNQIFVKTPFKELIPPLNPHQFDYKQYLAKQYIYHQLFINNSQFMALNTTEFSLTNVASSIRNNIQQSLKKHQFSTEQFAVINALLLGQRQEISKELLESYTNAGAIHILAISGLHIGILLLLFSYVLSPLNRFTYGPLIKTICIVFLLWSFAFIAGLSASVVRAVTMFTFIAIGQSFKRKKIIEFSLISSMLFLLLIKPMFLFDVGFQLSYLAVFGIVWVQPLLYNLWKPKLLIIDKGWQLFTVSVAAQVGILPISLYYFHQFPGLFILSNLIIIPFLGGILALGVTIILLSVTNILPQILADMYGYLITMMNDVVKWISYQEGFLLKEISMSFWAMLAWYAFIVFMFRFLIHKNSKSLIMLLTSIVLLQGVYFYEKHQRTTKREFIVFHKSRQSITGFRNNEKLSVISSLKDTVVQQEKLLQAYRIGEQITSNYIDSMFAIYPLNKSHVMFVDSLGVYKITQLTQPIVVLQNSPKINLNRLIATLQPQQIIADGSNYKSYVTRWQKTCIKQKTPFCYTGQNGAFIIRY